MSWVLKAQFAVRAIPKAQPRTKATIRGTYAAVYTPQTARGWKDAIIESALRFPVRGLECPIALKCEFFLKRPKARKKELFVTTKPDIDNLLKSTMDALTELGIWRDDAQVCETSASKKYETEAIAPGADIAIYAWE